MRVMILAILIFPAEFDGTDFVETDPGLATRS